MIQLLKRFFGPVPSAMHDVLNLRELAHSALTALGASSVLGLLVLILTGVSDHAARIFPDPTVAALATFAIAQVVDQLRRLDHGGPPAPAKLLDAPPGFKVARSAEVLAVNPVLLGHCPADEADPHVGGPGYEVVLHRGDDRPLDRFLLTPPAADSLTRELLASIRAVSDDLAAKAVPTVA